MVDQNHRHWILIIIIKIKKRLKLKKLKISHNQKLNYLNQKWKREIINNKRNKFKSKFEKRLNLNQKK